MAKKMKTKNSVVKINTDLLVNIEAFINLDKNKFKYVNKKQFIDIAVTEFLRKEMRHGK